MIAELFKERRRRFRSRCAKYSRYVFNDHFVLVLLFLLGFILVQYSQLLQNFPDNPVPILLGLLVLCVFLPYWGNTATYLEPADKHYLLAKEDEVIRSIQKATRHSYIFWTTIQSLILLLVAPLFLASGFPIWGVVLLLLLLALVKYLVFKRRENRLYSTSGLDWSQAISVENKRQQTILKFFSLFTNVKGISSTVKRRAYLDVLFKRVSKQADKAWYHLYLRAFLRSGDYFALTLRLFGLSLLSILLIQEKWLAMILVAVFNYLLLFQLTALKQHFAYQTMANLMPIGKEKQTSNLKRLIGQIILGMTVIEAFFLWDLQFSFLLLALMLVLVFLYLPRKLKKMID